MGETDLHMFMVAKQSTHESKATSVEKVSVHLQCANQIQSNLLPTEPYTTKHKCTRVFGRVEYQQMENRGKYRKHLNIETFQHIIPS
jgi:hypothetical protein